MKTLIIKLLTGNITARELEQLRRLLKDPKNRAALKDHIRDDHDLNLALQENDVEAAYSRVMRNIEQQERKPVRPLFRPVLKYAAAVVVLLAIGFLGRQYFFSPGAKLQDTLMPKDEQITIRLGNGQVRTIDPSRSGQLAGSGGRVVATQNKNRLSYADSSPEQQGNNTLKVPYGKRFGVELSDGTKVYLNAGTTLKYPVRFSLEGPREVYLEGEAYFDVHKDEEHPFIVKAEELDIEVLGTEFNVSVYPEDKATDVVLVEGAVSMAFNGEGANDPAVLSPGNKGTLHHNAKTISVTEVNTGIYTAWMDGELVFRSMPFDDILKKLERHYNIAIENDNVALGKELFNASFNKVPIDSVLSFFSDAHKINFTIKDNKVFIE